MRNAHIISQRAAPHKFHHIYNNSRSAFPLVIQLHHISLYKLQEQQPQLPAGAQQGEPPPPTDADDEDVDMEKLVSLLLLPVVLKKRLFLS